MLSFLRAFLGEVVSEGTIEDVGKTALEKFQGVINIVIPIALAVVLLIGTIYAIILGVQYSKAEEAEARKTARERLVGAIVGFVITLVLILVIYAVLNVIPAWFK